MADVLRLKIQDPCLVIDGSSAEATARVSRFLADGRAELVIEKKSGVRRPPHFSLSAYVAIPQHGKLDFLIEKAQELGLAAFHPLETRRTVVRMSEAKKEKAFARWQKIAREAAKQSGASSLMKLTRPRSLKETLEEIPAVSPVILFHPDERAVPIKEWLKQLEEPREKGRSGDSAALHLFFGPEGGFAPEEVRRVLDRKPSFQVGLGESLLKVDTAFLAVTSALRLLLP